MELDPGAKDTLVVSLHQDAVHELACYPYDFAALVWLALAQAKVFGSDGPQISNPALVFFLCPLDFLTAEEVLEAVDRLVSRGFVHRLGPDPGRLHVTVNSAAVRVTGRRELPAQFLMRWNAAKAGWGQPETASGAGHLQ